jgi:hypothetical protein
MGAGRPKNSVESSTLTITTTPQVIRALEKLTQEGTWGKNPAETAERIVSEAIRSLVDQGKFVSRADLNPETRSSKKRGVE